MINWKKITKDNFTEFLSEWSLEEIAKYGIVIDAKYHDDECERDGDGTYVFLSKEGCVLNHAWVYFTDDGRIVGEAQKAECSEYTITHFALKSEFNKILPKGATDVSTDI